MSIPDDSQTNTVEQAMGRLDCRGAQVRAEQLERALSRLNEQGELTDEQRAAVEQLSERLVEAILAGARGRVRESSNPDATARTVLELFG